MSYVSVCTQNNLVIKPKESFITTKDAANRQKDDISHKFNKPHEPDSTAQCFSWHQTCMG